MENEKHNVGSVKRQLAKLFKAALEATVPNEPDVEPLVAACTTKFGDYQCNNAMGLWSKIKGKQNELKGPLSVGQAIIQNLPQSEMIESCSVAGPGFVNAVLSKDWMAKSLQKMLVDGIDTWAPRLPIKRAIVDFSSPNVAKEMHVGHLRSTIIGDTLARMLEFSNVEVLRRNHIGDWGTQRNTAVYLLYAHARICLIIRKSGKNIEELKNTGAIMLDHADEHALGLHLLQFSEEEACTNLLTNVLCEYLYNLSENFTKFYSNCQVVGSAAETSRLLPCEATATVMRKCFYLLGMVPVYKI